MYNCFQKVHDSVDDSVTCLMLKSYWLDQWLVMFPKDIDKQRSQSRGSAEPGSCFKRSRGDSETIY